TPKTFIPIPLQLRPMPFLAARTESMFLPTSGRMIIAQRLHLLSPHVLNRIDAKPTENMSASHILLARDDPTIAQDCHSGVQSRACPALWRRHVRHAGLRKWSREIAGAHNRGGAEDFEPLLV